MAATIGAESGARPGIMADETIVIINDQAPVCGMPVLVVRRLLRRTMHDFWTRQVVAAELEISPTRASRLISALRAAGYVEPVPGERRGTWRNTTLGNALANATTARPVKRSTAKRRLAEFLSRVREVNAKPGFAARVCELVAQQCGVALRETGEHFHAQACLDAVVNLSGALRGFATAFYKIANDIC